MFNLRKKERVITDFEKNQIIIEFLTDEIEVYRDMQNTDMNPVKLLEISLHFQKRKTAFLRRMDKGL